MVTVGLPSYLQQFADGNERVEVEAGNKTVGEVLDVLGTRFPGVRSRVLTEEGEIRTHINIFVGARNCRFDQGLRTVVLDHSEVLILAAVSGG